MVEVKEQSAYLMVYRSLLSSPRQLQTARTQVLPLIQATRLPQRTPLHKEKNT